MKKTYTREDVIAEVQDKDVEFIRLQFTDMFGQLKIWQLHPASWNVRWITVSPLTDMR